MLVMAMPSRIIWSGKELTRLIKADLTTCPGIGHITNLSNNKVPGTQCPSKVEASREIGMMMVILPLQGQDISNRSNNIIRSRTCCRFLSPHGWDPGLCRQMTPAISLTRYI
jgi:hypothetical protein